MEKLSKYPIVLVSILLFAGCSSMRTSKMTSNYSQIPETTKRLDIPEYDLDHPFKGHPYVYWHFTKQKERQLDLVSAEQSNDSLIFRVWRTNPVRRKGQPHGLIEIKQDSSGWWSANLYSMYVDFSMNNLTETITRFEKMEVTPQNNDWNFIIDSLYQLSFHILPTDDAIPDYYSNNTGYDNNLPTFSFEYATKEKYRFYQYNDFVRKAGDFWQANYVLKILDLLNDELNWFDLIENSLDSLSGNERYIYDHHDKRLFYSFRADAGAFVPLDNLRNVLGTSPNLGIYFGFPLTEKYRFDLGTSVFIPINTNELEYFLPDETLTGKAILSGTMGFWVSRSDVQKNSWIMDNRLGTGLGFFQTDIPTNKPKEDNDSVYGSETIFLCLGTGLRKGRIGLSLNYYFVPYNAFKKSFKTDFGSQYLTISTYYTF